MTKPKNILLVDDDYDFLESLQLIMFEEGHRVYPVSNGHDAIIQYKKLKPDIVFLDIKMPGIDGYDTFKSIKKFDPKAKIVLMSGHILDIEKYALIEKLVVGVESKPLQFNKVKKLIKKYTN